MVWRWTLENFDFIIQRLVVRLILFNSYRRKIKIQLPVLWFNFLINFTSIASNSSYTGTTRRRKEINIILMIISNTKTWIPINVWHFNLLIIFRRVALKFVKQQMNIEFLIYLFVIYL